MPITKYVYSSYTSREHWVGPSEPTVSWAWARTTLVSWPPLAGVVIMLWVSTYHCDLQCPTVLEMLGPSPSPVFSYLRNFGEDYWGNQCCALLQAPSSWGHWLSFNHWVPGPKTCSGVKLGRELFLLLGVTVFSLFPPIFIF